VIDIDGKNATSTTISHITNDEHGVVTTLDETRHGFEDGCFVKFNEVKGMIELNEKEIKIKVLGPYTFSIGDTSKFSNYTMGGIAEEVKKSKIIQFVSLSLSLSLLRLINRKYI
jgi:ubiquitin-activating enzyme E1